MKCIFSLCAMFRCKRYNLLPILANGWSLIFALFGLAVVKTGISEFPAWDIYTRFLSTYPDGSKLLPLQQYLLHSPVTALIAALFNCTGRYGYFLVCFGLVCSALLILPMLLISQKTPKERIIVISAFYLTPIPSLLLNWVGSPDVIIVAATLCLVLSQSLVLTFLAAVVLAFQHSQVGMLIALYILTLDMLTNRHVKNRAYRWGLIVMGVACGLVAIKLAHVEWGVVYGREEWFKHYGPLFFVKSFLRNPYAVIYSGLGCAWVVMVIIFRETAFTTKAALLTFTAMSIGVSALVYDHTRILGLLLLPILLHLSLTNADRIYDIAMRYRGIAAGMMLVPTLIIWEGRAYVGSWATIYGLVMKLIQSL